MSLTANEHWGRWIFATMSGDLDSQFNSTYEIFIEGTHRGLPENEELIEFRMDGPWIRQPSRGCFILRVEVNLLLRSYMDDDDFHKMRRLCGAVQSWLGQNHCIYRYGDGIDDDQSLLGTLELKNRKDSEPIRLNQFGQVDPRYRLEEATVEATFEIHLQQGD